MMRIDINPSFSRDLEKIDKVIVINDLKITPIPVIKPGEKDVEFSVICHDNLMQVCVIGAKGDNASLEFYYNNEELAFTITGVEKLNPERTIFEITLPQEPKAKIECPFLSEDAQLLEGIGTNPGSSLYKDIQVSEDSLVWKESFKKYLVDKGLTDNHNFDIELLDTRSGRLEERPIKFKSYKKIIVDKRTWDIDTIEETKVEKHDVYSNVSRSSFLVWNSPMIDAEVNLDENSNYINNLRVFLNPGEVVIGNTDCYQFIVYQSNLKGFKVWGVEGSEIEFMFNREYSDGPYVSIKCKIDESGVAEIKVPELPFYHFNGITTLGPSRINYVYTIMELEDPVIEYIPNPDKTYVARINKEKSEIKIDGYAEYVEYEKYLGEINEIGRGFDNINNIPNLNIILSEDGNLDSIIDSANRQIIVKSEDESITTTTYKTYQLEIKNNIEVNGNVISISPLLSEYKIKIKRSGIVWKIYESPDYINKENGLGIYTIGSKDYSKKTLTVLTNYTLKDNYYIVADMDPEAGEYFDVVQEGTGEISIDGVNWKFIIISLQAQKANEEGHWVPQNIVGTEVLPFKLDLVYDSVEDSVDTGISLYAVQLNDTAKMEIWEEVSPGQFKQSETSLTLFDVQSKSFIVVKRVPYGEMPTVETWYYYDLVGYNRFYLTDYNYQAVNSGVVYHILNNSIEQTIKFQSNSDRLKYCRIVTANRSDYSGSLGILSVTDSLYYPASWRDVIDSSASDVEVFREVDNIYIDGGQPSPSDFDDSDIEIPVNSINLYSFDIRSNYRYTIRAFGYIKIAISNGQAGAPPYLVDELDITSEYTNLRTIKFALLRLDKEEEMKESYLEVKSGEYVKIVSVKVDGPITTHDYLVDSPYLRKPNLIRIFKNGSFIPDSSDNTRFQYKSTTTPVFECMGVTLIEEETNPVFDFIYGYRYHNSDLSMSILNYRALSNSRYPMKSFGGIRELSLSYSDTEVPSSLWFQFFMKGKEHFIWGVDNLRDFSGLIEPEVDSEGRAETVTDLILDTGGAEKNVYVVSRYGIGNNTFITESPDDTEFKIIRNDLEANIKISTQQKINLDIWSQIEYVIPIRISSNIQNNGGNIFLGDLEYKAITNVTNNSISDIIEIDEEILQKEGIDKEYINNYIVSDKIQTLRLRIFQLGNDESCFRIFSGVSTLGIGSTLNYIIPEIGNLYTISSFDCSIRPADDICSISSTFDSKYFLVTVTSEERVLAGNNWHSANYNASTGKYDISSLKQYIDSKNYEVKMVVNRSESTTLYNWFTKYGCNYGLYIDGSVGLGYLPDDFIQYSDTKRVELPASGGTIAMNAGIFYAVDGLWKTEALLAPKEYKFVGENQPLSISWEDGNLDGSGNLIITVPPRVRDDVGEKTYILQVTQPHEYCPVNLYIIFYQPSLYNGSEDIGKLDYKLKFIKDAINIYSDGSVENGEDKLYFVHNLNESEFSKVYFKWDLVHGTYPTKSDFYPDDLVLEEVERSYNEGYVKFDFRPNGSRTFLDGYIKAYYDNSNNKIEIGSIRVKQGYYSLTLTYKNPSLGNITETTTSISRLNPSQILLYYTGSGSSRVSHYSSSLPCKSNSDNLDSSDFCGRGVFKMEVYKREYYDDVERVINVKDVFEKSVIAQISPRGILESSELSYVATSSNDHDAKVNPKFNSNNEYVTNTDFHNYNPYVEINYIVKDDYVWEDEIINASCRIILKDPDSGESINYYFLVSGNKKRSNQPVDPMSFTLSSYKLKFGSGVEMKQVSYHPESTRLQFSKYPINSPWFSCSEVQDSNIIAISVTSNQSSDQNNAYYRTAQVKVELLDERDDSVIRTVYIDVEQEPDYPSTNNPELAQHIVVEGITPQGD